MVMEKGRIVEMGTPDERLEKNGIYRKIYDMQLSISEDETA